MPSLLTLRPAGGYLTDALPHAYSEAGHAQFKSMPGVRWVRDRNSPTGRGYYQGPTEAVAIVARTLAEARVVVLKHERPNVFSLPIIHGVKPPSLRDYQWDGACWLHSQLVTTGGALLADDMGIGKTIQAITALNLAGGPTIVVCPAVVVSHWHAQIQKWSEGKGWWLVLSYDAFRTAAAGGSKPDKKGRQKIGPLPQAAKALLLDEGHYLSNPKSLRSKAIAGWLAVQQQRPAVVILTGTPMTTRPRDLWHLLDLMHPGRWGSWFAFTKRYCDGRYEELPHMPERSVWVSDGASRADELAERLRAVMLRRTKDEVALELPPRTRITIDVEIPLKARAALARASAAINWQEGRHSGVSSLLSNIEDYKTDAAIALVEDITAAGGRTLVLTLRKATAAALGRALAAPVVDGDVPPGERQQRLANAQVGVATLYSVTTGIDLIGYDSIVFTGLDWVPSTMLQGEARIHRIGQTRPVTIYYLIGTGTLDEVVRERVIVRLDQFAALAGGDGTGGMARDLAGGESDEELLTALVAACGKAA